MTKQVKKFQSEQQSVTEMHVLITQTPNPGATFKVRLDKAIVEPSEYRTLCGFLEGASPEDTFLIYLNGPGGHLDSCLQVVHAIANTQATVIGHLVGEVHSAHSNIFMACHQHVLYPYTLMMIHTLSGGYYGKGEDPVRMAKAYNKVTASMYKDIYAGFLTDDEFDAVLSGNNDIYFVGDEIAERLELMYKAREEMALVEQEQKEKMGAYDPSQVGSGVKSELQEEHMRPEQKKVLIDK